MSIYKATNVVGADPPWETLNGFLNRIWQDKDIDKISFLPNGIFVIRFMSKAKQLEVLEKGYVIFDGKLVVIKAWDPNLKITKGLVKTVPIWAKLVGLDLKFWGVGYLAKIASLIGNFIQLDVVTHNKTLLGYARIMVKVHIGKDYPQHI